MIVIAKASKLPILTCGRVAEVTAEGVVLGLDSEWPGARRTPMGLF